MEEMITTRMPNSACRPPAGGYQKQDIHQNMAVSAQQMVQRIGGPPVKVASRRSRAETLRHPSQRQQRQDQRSAVPRSAQPHTYDEEEAPMTTQPGGRRSYRDPDTEDQPYLQGRIERSGKPSRRSTQAAADTYDDEEARVARTTRSPKSVKPSRRTPSRGVHPLIWVGLTMLVLIVLWITIPIGESWWVTHVSDPGQFGPMHGSVTTGVFGGGDSETKPSKLIGFNDEGKIRIILFHGDDAAHSQVLVGPNLASQDWPDPRGSSVQLETGDVDHDGNLDLRVTILGASFDASFQRVQQTYILYGDGKGNLKREPPQPAGGAS